MQIVEPQLFNVYIQHIADKRLGLRISNDAYPFLLNPCLLYHYSDSEIIRQDIKVGEPSLNLDYIFLLITKLN